MKEAAILRQCRMRVAELEKGPAEKPAVDVDVETRRATVKKQIERFLEVSAEQSTWIVEFVCALRAQHAEIVAEVTEGRAEIMEAAEKRELERTEALADLEKFLGKEKYDRLRKVGGVGLLGELAICE